MSINTLTTSYVVYVFVGTAVHGKIVSLRGNINSQRIDHVVYSPFVLDTHCIHHSHIKQREINFID